MSSEKKSITIINGEYTMENEIGRGSFATVYKGHRIDDKNQHIAIKAVSRSKLKNKKLLENLEIEIAILKKIKHPHIVGLMDCERTSTDFYLVMEYCALGDLTFLIRRRKELMESHPLLRTVFEKYPPPSEHHNGLHRAFVISYLQQLASALRFLRSKNLVHRDIKPQNLLLATPLVGYHDSKSFHDMGFVGIYNLPILKIADFGFARFLPNTSLAETLCGSPLYMAPEILNYQKYNAKADLWSVGTVLYEMACGKPPFKASNHLELFKKIKRANDTISFPTQCDIEPELKKLICGLLTFDPSNRMGFAEFFDNILVNEDLSRYELEDAIPELETKSKDVVESNMFISEYLARSPKKQSGSSTNANALLGLNTNLKPLTAAKSEERASSAHESNAITTGQTTKNINSPTRPLRRNVSIDKSNRADSGSDLMLEKEYVVVEKKSVEVNALADEFAQAGPCSIVLQPSQHQQLHQKTNSSSTLTPTNTAQQVQQQQQQTQFLKHRNSRNSSGSSTSRRPSLVDRRLSITSLNPSNALSRALGIASSRLFGGGATAATDQQQQHASNSSSPNYRSSLLNPKIFQDLTENIILRVEHLQNEEPKKLDSNSIVQLLETLSAKAFVIFSYAEVKFSQIAPLSGPHFEKRLSNGSCAIEEEEGEEEEENTPAVRQVLRKRDSSRGSDISQNSSMLNELPAPEMRQLCTEAIVLYMKSLSILAKAMHITSNWWYDSQEKVYSLRLNLLVQWIREKFNECLEKADFLRLKLNDLKLNTSSGATIVRKEHSAESAVTTGEEHENNLHPDHDECCTDEPIYLEKILYDRALEISKTAAKLEIQGEHLSNCELAYATSLWMLETLLDETTSDDPFGETDIVTTGVLDDQDRKIIRKYIDSIANRLKALREKINKG